jgi:hypothetical protein
MIVTPHPGGRFRAGLEHECRDAHPLNFVSEARMGGVSAAEVYL